MPLSLYEVDYAGFVRLAHLAFSVRGQCALNRVIFLLISCRSDQSRASLNRVPFAKLDLSQRATLGIDVADDHAGKVAAALVLARRLIRPELDLLALGHCGPLLTSLFP